MKMNECWDSIKFTDLSEIEELMEFILKYVKQNPSEKDNDILKRFYYLLEELTFMW